MKVWGLEPYHGGSHHAFLAGLARHSSHDFTLLTLPGRHWKWRMHGGSLALAAQADALLTAGVDEPDVLFVSDMLDLPAFLSLMRRGRTPGGSRSARLVSVPSVVYFHENQLTYPLPSGVERDLGYGFKNLITALAADIVLFNSAYHRLEFLTAAEELLAALPDAVPARAVEEVAAKSSVLSLGCDLRALDCQRARGREEAAAGRWGDPGTGPLVVWNQRWEYDKGPEELFQTLRALDERGEAFRLAVAGSGGAVPPAYFQEARQALAGRVVHWGRVEDRAEYAALLWAADIVVSTAIHEFFGVAVVEAVYCGCRPVLPRRLSYPEIVPPEVHGDVLYGEGDLLEALARALAAPHAWSEDWQRSWVARFDWGSLIARYDQTIRECATIGRPPWTGFR